jgi:hypothetical protein
LSVSRFSCRVPSFVRWSPSTTIKSISLHPLNGQCLKIPHAFSSSCFAERMRDRSDSARALIRSLRMSQNTTCSYAGGNL